jgi:hypothetical protein
MADGLDPVPASQQSDGRWKIGFVPSGTGTPNPLSIAVLKAATSFNMTYSFTPDGFAYAVTQASVEDKRLTLTQDLSRPGKTSETLENKYVETLAAGSASVVLKPNTAGYFVVRRGVDNATDWAVGQIVDVISIIAGAQRPDAPTENGLDTITQAQFITAPTQRKVALVA